MTPERLAEGVELYEGDCLEVLRSLPDGAVDAVITDPPYSARTHTGHDSVTGSPAGDAGYDGAKRKPLGYGAWSAKEVWHYVPEFCRVSAGWVAVMTDHTLAPLIIDAMRHSGRYVFAPLPFYSPGSRVRLSGDGPSSWTDWIIVARTAKQMKWGTLPGGYSPSPGVSGWRDKEHMGGKPTRLMRELVRDYSRPGDTVMDPFAGSGTLLVAAAMEKRKAIGCELDSHYCDIIRQRVRKADCREQGNLFAEAT